MKQFREHAESFNALFQSIKLGPQQSDDKAVKIRQILSYLEVIDAQVRKMSKRRKIVFVDSAAGNCYLSFLVYHYYTEICKRDIEIHCIDHNESLMKNCETLSRSLGFSGMFFYTADILELDISTPVDVLYTLHACDRATDKSLYLWAKLNARVIFSVACCQHSLGGSRNGEVLKGIRRYPSYKSRIIAFAADAMRAHLMAIQGYDVDIFDFTSSRNTEKNSMIRAKRNPQVKTQVFLEEYHHIQTTFRLRPYLEELFEVRGSPVCAGKN